ncbi:MAG TPA: DUF4164 family protein [Caulobacteraceae bacterium]
MTADAAQLGRIDLAIQRLGRAMALLEQRVGQRLADAATQAGGALAQDRARLAADLEVAHGRHRELAEAGALASEALGRAIAEITATLGERAP